MAQSPESKTRIDRPGKTYCNPLNISYRFCLSGASRREAADPTIVLYKNTYFMFASKSGGYWYSSDLLTWNFVTTTDLPLENYAPTAVVINDWLYFMASTGSSKNTTIYRTDNPVTGKWKMVNDSFPIRFTDPALFADSDGRVYLYYGCSNINPIYGVELDLKNKLNPIGKPVAFFAGNADVNGWEQRGDYNDKTDKTWIEGSWMNKYNGKYYLQYATPGTEFKSYVDGCYVSDKPLGPFAVAANNPFSSKPQGFVAGAGHGSTFADKYGNWWHVATLTVSVKHPFERRLGLFPAGFDKDGSLFTYTEFGDYPLIMPDRNYTDVRELFPGWMLLSYKKHIESSSVIDTFPASYACDENIRTYWSARTGNKGEWLSIDLGTPYTINAVQINFAENNTHLFGRNGILCHRYLIEFSIDKQKWTLMIDKTANDEDLTHPYAVMEQPVKARYVRITNYRVPDGTFAISDFRIFGKGTSSKPAPVSSFNILRDKNDPRIVKLSWKKQSNAIGYNIRFGSEKDKLYHSYQVYNDTSVIIRSLNRNQSCWFVIDSFGENGIANGKRLVEVR